LSTPLFLKVRVIINTKRGGVNYFLEAAEKLSFAHVKKDFSELSFIITATAWTDCKRFLSGIYIGISTDRTMPDKSWV